MNGWMMSGRVASWLLVCAGWAIGVPSAVAEDSDQSRPPVLTGVRRDVASKDAGRAEAEADVEQAEVKTSRKIDGQVVRAHRIVVPPPAEMELDSARKLTESQHPLAGALKIAVDAYEHIQQNVHDYECRFMRRERVDGELGAYEYMDAKVRHARQNGELGKVPYSVYLKFLKPAALRDREVLYVDGLYRNRLIVHNGGGSFSYVTTELRPESNLAMHGNRYPITEFGFENLLKRLIEVAQEDILREAECKVTFYENSKINQRPCTGVLVVHPERDAASRFHMARVFLDKELKIPLLFESYDWPAETGGKPQLLEQYSYSDVRLNVGLTDADFDRENPSYRLKATDDQETERAGQP